MHTIDLHIMSDTPLNTENTHTYLLGAGLVLEKNHLSMLSRGRVWHTASRIVCAWMCVQALPRAMAGLLVPSSTGVDAYPLVLCTGLDEAVSNLRSLELTAHDVGLASIEAQCVHINPCTQQSQQDNDFHAVPVNT